jgi:small GTP-binding protein
VGKTSLIRRYTENKFAEDYLPTLGVDITVKRMTIDNERVRLVLMDTAGGEKFGRLRKTYFEESLGCIAVYDITRRETLEDHDRWIAEYRKVAGENRFVTIIGNKIDLVVYRTVTTKEGRKFSRTLGFPFYKSSAKLGGAVIPKIYIELVRKCLARIRT